MPPFQTPPGHAKKSTFSTTSIQQATTVIASPCLTAPPPPSPAPTSSTNASPSCSVVNTIELNAPHLDGITGQVVATGRGRHNISLRDDDIRDWALITRDRRPDRIWSIGTEDRIGVLGAKRVSVTGHAGRIKVRDHRDRTVAVIRDDDITLAQARDMVLALPQGWAA